MAWSKNPQSILQRFFEIVELYITGRVVKAAQTLPVSASNATTMDCSKGDVWTYTPTESTTITPINLAPGQRVSLIILTSGTNSYTLTFGTPFKVTGTLASGASDGKYFVISFITNGAGTVLAEESRTTAM